MNFTLGRPGSRLAAALPNAILSGIFAFTFAAAIAPIAVRGASPQPVAQPTAIPRGSATGQRNLPAITPLEGLDVSRWQGTINWPQVKAAGKQFVVMKATEGTDYVDPMFATNRAGATAVGIPMTAYDFASPDATPNEAVLEADHLVAVAGFVAGNLPPVLDLEQTGGLAPAALQVWVRAWLDEVTAKLGIRPMIYVSPSFWSTKMANNTSIALAGYKTLWIANWGVTSPTVPANNWSGNGYTFWQYTDCGHVAGITTGCVDLDRYNGTDLTPVLYNPTFSLSANPTGQSIMRGATTTFAISVNRNQFVPPVTLSVTSPMPSGTTYSFSPNPVTGSSSTLTITTSNVPAVTPPGVVTPTITGIGGGLTKTTLANLTVLPALPDPPTAVVATPLDASAFVTWAAPANDGGGPIASYTVTSAPGGKTCTATGAVSCIVKGLDNGTPYSFSVTAHNPSGNGTASAASSPVTPVPSIPGATYFAVGPTRLVDTRSKVGLTGGALKAGAANTFQVTGVGPTPVPAGAIAVTGNLTVTGQTAAGYFALTPVATKTPKSSTLNFPTGDSRANGVTVQLGPGGKLGLTYVAAAGARAQAIFDVTGYFLPGASGASYFPLGPTRLVNPTVIPNRVARTVQVAGVAGIPVGAIAVTGNLTVVKPASAGYVAVTSVATNAPKTSTLNFPAHDIRANALTAALSGGKLSFTYAGSPGSSAEIIFDVTGYFLPGASGASYFGLSPTRLLDTRTALGVNGATKAAAIKAGTESWFLVTGRNPNPALNVPDGAVAVTGNLTVTGQTAAGYLALTSAGTKKPTTSTINFPLGDTRANGVTVALGSDGKLWMIYMARPGATVQTVFDVTGYFLAPG